MKAGTASSGRGRGDQPTKTGRSTPKVASAKSAKTGAPRSIRTAIHQDSKTAEAAASMAVLFGSIRESQRAGYIKGWLNLGFYQRVK